VKTGRYAEALLEFESSFAIRQTSGAMLNMADCYEKLGRYASASAAFDRAAKLATDAGQADRANEANERKTAVAPLVSTVLVHGKSPEATVTFDGRPVILDTPFPVDGGEHTLRVEATCREPVEMHVTVGIRSDVRELSVEAGAPSRAPECQSSVPVQDKPVIAAESPSWSTQRTISVAVGGAGIVALGLGLGFGLSASSKQSSLEAACRDYPRGCPFDRRDELDRTADSADRAATISTVATISGLVLVGVATVLYFTSPTKR
jgi:hypothetical protein